MFSPARLELASCAALAPPAESLPILLALFQLLAGFGLLVFGADRFVTGAAHLARGLGVPPLIVGLTVVGFGTSMPEIMAGSVAAWDGHTDIAVGNAIGSNIFNVTVVLGVAILVRPMLVSSKTLRGDYTIMCVALLFALCFMLDRSLARLDGALLVLAMAGILFWLVHLATRARRSDPLAKEFREALTPVLPRSRTIMLTIVGLVVLVAGAELLLRGAVTIARGAGLSDLIIGLTIVALGTSLPEVAASVAGTLKGESDIAIGNVIGSNTFNILVVLGIPVLIHPAAFGPEVLYRDFPAMLLFVGLLGVLLFFLRPGRLGRAEGATLILCFIGYQYWLLHATQA